MFAKLLLLILTGALTATSLLAIRQQRVQAGHDMIEAFDRARQQREQLWTLRSKIVRRLGPERIEQMAEDLGPLQPIPLYWCPPALVKEAETSDDELDTPRLVSTLLLPPTDPLTME